MLQSNTVDYMLQQSDVISGPGNAVRCVVKSERCRGRVSLSLSPCLSLDSQRRQCGHLVLAATSLARYKQRERDQSASTALTQRQVSDV